MIKLTWMTNDPRWGSELWVNGKLIRSIFRAPHKEADKQANCTRICVGANEDEYFDVQESIEEILALIAP
jgi:hypothetical protein